MTKVEGAPTLVILRRPARAVSKDAAKFRSIAFALSALALALAPAAQARPKKPPALPVQVAPSLTDADFRAVDPRNLLVIDTNKGRILAELAPDAAPGHVERIRTLAQQHFYDGQTFFRVIDDFMDQTGDPHNKGDGGSTLPNLKAEFTFRRGPATPFVTVAEPSGADLGFLGSLPVMSQSSALMGMTADGKVAAWGLYCPGVLGGARDEDPDSANSQFFLMRHSYPSLEKRYTAFGRVVSGLDVVQAIKVGEPVPEPQDRMIAVRLASDLPEAQRPRVRVIDTAGPALKAMAARVRLDRGADFSVCDIDLPVKVN